MVLRIGDLVPADLRLVQTTALMVDESALTGESFPREKSSGDANPMKPLAERNSELFYGTHVVSGTGQGLFMTDFPALAIFGDSVDPENISSPRAWDMKSIRRFMILFGLLSSVFDILMFVILRAGFGASVVLFRSG